MSYDIRPLRTEDYSAATEIYNAQNEPHHHLTEEEMRRADERAKERSFYRFLSAVKDGEVIATGQFGERPGDDAPGKFWTWYFVREDHRGTGVDTAMFDRSLELLAGRDPRSLWTCVREDFLPAAAYLTDRGFEEQFRSWGANLDLAGFHPSEFGGLRSGLEERGIELRSYADLASDPERDTKLAALQAELEDDAPHCEPIIPQRHPDPHHPRMLLDSYVVAVHGSEYVGLASLMDQPRFPNVAGSGLTGVKREYRGQGIGTTLLAHTSAWAKEQGYDEVNGGGAGANAPMLAAIRRVGFDVEPAWVTLAKFL